MTRLRLKYSIQDLTINEEEIDFKFKIDHDLIVRLYEPNKEYKQKSKSPFTVFCDAELQIEPNRKNFNLLDDLIEGRVVKDKSGIPAPFTELKNHKGKDIIIPPLQKLPDHFQDFITQIRSELDKAIKNTITTLRWFYNNQGRHNPFAYRDFEFTNDNINWYPLPISIHVDIESLSRKINLKKADAEKILNLILEENGEPVYHSLYREAWDQKRINPRSALIMGISAAEVAVKRLIETIVPDAGWLITNIQSPPIHTILRDYIPRLPIKNHINGIPVLPTDEMLKDLKKWVGIRNKISHLGEKSLSGDELKEMLLTIKDILHIIDFNIGHKWALNFIRETTLKSIGIK